MAAVVARGAVDIARSRGSWRIVQAEEKLRLRGALPGAFAYDQAAAAFARVRDPDTSPALLLPAALPASWLVNARASSPVFRRWLEPPRRGIWSDLLEWLDLDASAWLTQPPARRTEVAAAVDALAIDGHSVAALSKVLALLCPHCVPLMDDPALDFALEPVPHPCSAEAPAAPPSRFVPMLDWFATAVCAARETLASCARSYTLAPLGAAQVLDRLLWFDSWGFRHARAPTGRRAFWVQDAEREGVVLLDAPHPIEPGTERIDVSSVPDARWRDAVRRALDGA